MLREGGRAGVRKFVLLLSDGQQSPIHGGDKVAIDAAAAVRADKSLVDASGLAMQVRHPFGMSPPPDIEPCPHLLAVLMVPALRVGSTLMLGLRAGRK